jgi:hypothetical protein
MKYMYEIRCAANNERTDVDFTSGCYNHWLVTEKEVPKATGKRCEFCNGKLWSVKVTNISMKTHFKRMLKDPHGTFGYHVSEEAKLYKVS